MLADGRTVPQNEVIETEVCVVGGGPAGITVAKTLTEAGLEVLLLERGPTRREGIPDSVNTGTNAGIEYPVNESRSFEFGGATYNWRVATPLGPGFGRLRELDDSDFERRPWIRHSGWPFGKVQLAPFYRRAESLFDLPWTANAPDSWDSGLRHSPFSDDTPNVEVRPFYFVSPGNFAGDLLRRLEYSDKALVLTNSVVTDLRTDEYLSSISSLRVATSATHAFEVEAQVYVLAAGGIENPRLLLSSTSHHKSGIGNGQDLVGRFFMEHPHYASGCLLPNSSGVFNDRNSYAIYLHNGVPVQKKYGLSDRLSETEGLGRCVYRLEAKPKNESMYTLRYGAVASRRIQAAGNLRHALTNRQWSSDIVQSIRESARGFHHIARLATHRTLVRACQRLGLEEYTRPYLFWIRAMAEQLPDPSSRVRLLAAKDNFGVPLVELNWRLNEQDLRTIERSQRLLGEAWTVSGLGQVESLVERDELPPALSGGKHHMGTTRMSDSPHQGVVDRHCRVHGMSNLFVAGSSVFPTSGYANPTLTILALSCRLADHVTAMVRSKEQWRISQDLN